jgi:hydroxymethylbilane synthase
MPLTITVATRKSALALAQTRAFVRALIAANPGLVVEELHVVTTGDRVQDRPLSEIGGKGLFVKEIEEALLDRRADLAVHSMKDLPAELPEGLAIVCTPERADPRDVLLVRAGEASLMALKKGARVGSSSLRRKLSLLAARPDLDVTPLRGNIDTRVRKLEAGDYDAIVLAAAGLGRIGVDPKSLPPHAAIDPSVMLPAVAQGVLAIEARADDARVKGLLLPLDHHETRIRATIERGVLKALGADCTVPLAAFSERVGDRFSVRAWLDDVEGGHRADVAASEAIASSEEAHALGDRLGRRLLEAHRSRS